MQARFTLSVKADLRPFWTWNTNQMFVYLQGEYETAKNGVNQISLFDDIIRDKAKVALNRSVRQEYQFMDQGNSLRGKQLNMTLVWCIMPKVGAPPSLPLSILSRVLEYSGLGALGGVALVQCAATALGQS